uniref:AB hydrolase-1 domain-containing protein n=1 Tax=Rhizophora mucronata TaxID=61149 RepID=A0A2P2IR34_RHIMU
MAPSFISFVSLYSFYLRRCFAAAGLSQRAVDIDGETTIHVWAPKANNPSNSHKPSLVLIHGFGPATHWQWRQQVQFFAPIFNVYVPDLIFFGGSTTKSSERSEVFQAKSVAKLLEKLGVEKYHVVGTSYGGMVAYNLGRMWPERVEKVVVASSGVNMKKSDNEELAKRVNLENTSHLLLPQTASEMRALLGVAVAKPLRMAPDFLLNDLIKTLYRDKRNEKLELLQGLTLGRDETASISPLQQNVLVVWGEDDKIFPVEMAKELQGLIGKNVRLEIIQNASHVPQIERPMKFNYTVKNFLCGGSS